MKRERLYRLRDLIRRAAEALPDEDALQGVELFAPWQAGRAIDAGVRLRYGGGLYRVLQAHTSQEDWPPELAPALYERVAEPGQGGTAEDPIAYAAGMALECGSCYAQDGAVYRCTRSTGAPVYNPLAELVGLYVELVSPR